MMPEDRDRLDNYESLPPCEQLLAMFSLLLFLLLAIVLRSL
jgi:hypothetical protein